MKQVRLNRLEIWVADHAAQILLVVATLVIIGAIAIFFIFAQQGETQHQVDVLEPKVTRVVRAAAICSSETIKEKESSDACAARLRFALVVCRHSPRCRAAVLAIVNYPPPSRSPAATTEGGGARNPSNSGQQPGPGKPGPHGDSGQDVVPAPSPVAPAPPAPEPGPPVETPGNGPPAGAGKPSGAGVEVCATSKCVDVGVDVNPPKGLLP